MSDFIFTDEESQAKAAETTASSISAVPKKRRAPAKKKAVRSAPARASVPAPSRSSSAASGNSTAWLLIFICLLAVAAYFAYQYYALKNGESEMSNNSDYQAVTMASTTSDNTAANTDPAANWLVFTYPDAAVTSTASTSPMFSLKYPVNTTVNKTDKRVVFDITGATSTSFIVSWEKTNLDLTAYLKNLDKISAKSWEGKPAVEVVTSTAAKMADKYPVMLRQQKMLAADLNQYVAYIKTSSTMYAVALTAPILTDSETAAFSIFLNNFIIKQ